MTTKQITAIALRLLAIWLLVQMALNISSLIVLLVSLETNLQQKIPVIAYVIAVISTLAVGAVVAFILFRTSSSVLSKIDTESPTTLSANDQKFIFQILGCYFIVNAIAYLPRSLSGMFHSLSFEPENYLWAAGLTVQLVVGVLLVTSTVFWVELFTKLRGRA